MTSTIPPGMVRTLHTMRNGPKLVRDVARADHLGANGARYWLDTAVEDGLVVKSLASSKPVTHRYGLTPAGVRVIETNPLMPVKSGPQPKEKIFRNCLSCGAKIKAETRTQRMCKECGGCAVRVYGSAVAG